MKVAIVHDWLNGMRGGEKVLEALLDLWPEATIYTLFHERGRVSSKIESRRIVTSWLDRLPRVYRRYRDLLPLFPAAAASLDVGRVDLVVSSSHAVAKSVRGRGARHVCYCHTPMRYIWDAAADYSPNLARRSGLAAFGAALRRWDRATARRVDHFIANSRFVERRIQSCYGRRAEVIYPPVDTDFFTPPRDPSDFFLSVGALVAYKRVDLVIDACRRRGHRLVIAGEGPERARLERMAGEGIEFRGWVDPGELRELYRRARALVMAGREDFGIVPVEARSAGCPVVAYSAGGAAETLTDGVNAVLFHHQTAADLIAALKRFDGIEWSTPSIRLGTAGFSVARFKAEIRSFVAASIGGPDPAAAAAARTRVG